ncbi:MAG: HD domain-containing protein [Ferruginibacter sp.]
MLTNEIYETIRSKVLLNLSNNLSGDLLYHCVDHTIDVEMQAERIAISENITDPEDLILLKIACLYHDTGFLFTYNEHEEMGCDLAKQELAEFSVSPEQIEVIRGLILATRIPQKPLTKLEEIICDADLDYLGREDFFPIANNLYLELKAKGFVKTENDWNLIQVKFFKQHDYFTTTTKELRQQNKLKHLEMIEAVTDTVKATG